jgi:low temperature requirement protein LtrA
MTRTRRRLRATERQSVTFVELFFDLVFVFAVTQVTALTAHDLTAAGVLRSVLLFWLIWWAWTQFTWTLNPADTTHVAVRLITLVATGAAFIMAASVPHAFAGDGLWFALPYLAVRVLGLALQVRVDLETPGSNHAGVQRWAGLSVIGLLLVLAGAVADPEIRTWFWLAAIGADLVAASIAGRTTTWALNPGHVAERHGLFVIIAIGESLIVAGTAIAEAERTVPLMQAAVGALIVAGLMWWSYFGWLKDALEHRLASARTEDLGRFTRDAYSVAHFPLICGIVGFAVAIEEIVAHPDEPAGPAVVAALGVGIALFVGAAALSWWRLSGQILLPRIAVLVAMAVALAIVAPLAPVWPLAAVAIALLAIIALESVRAVAPQLEPGLAGGGRDGGTAVGAADGTGSAHS